MSEHAAPNTLAEQTALRLRAKRGTTIETVYKHWATDKDGFFHMLGIHDHNSVGVCKICKEEGRE